jgi:hypothetical protein
VTAKKIALRRRLERLSETKLNDTKDLANALLIVNESLQDLANRVIALEKVVVQEQRRAK